MASKKSDSEETRGNRLSACPFCGQKIQEGNSPVAHLEFCEAFYRAFNVDVPAKVQATQSPATKNEK